MIMSQTDTALLLDTLAWRVLGMLIATQLAARVERPTKERR
jgi:hypothetical protein